MIDRSGQWSAVSNLPLLRPVVNPLSEETTTPELTALKTYASFLSPVTLAKQTDLALESPRHLTTATPTSMHTLIKQTTGISSENFHN